MSLPIKSDFQGILGIFTAIPHFTAGGMKIGKENGFSVAASFISAFSGPLPLTVRDTKVDHYFILFGSGVVLGTLYNFGTIATRICDAVIRHQQFSEE